MPTETDDMNELLKAMKEAIDYGLSDLSWYPPTKTGMLGRVSSLLLFLNIVEEHLRESHQ